MHHLKGGFCIGRWIEILFVLLVANLSVAFAQPVSTIKGVVLDDLGEPLPGVNITIKNKKSGLVSDLDGKWELKTQLPITLVFSFVGFEPTEKKITKGGVYTIQLVSSSKAIDEVVVTGYYQTHKQTFTGAANNYSGKDLTAISNKNVISSLSAIDPSFKLVENINLGSNPNAIPDIQVRGSNSLPTGSGNSLSEQYKGGSNLPTFILDGFEVSAEKIYDLDPNRIQNISVLKDASATAIYGSRAANGVVIIDTKAPAAGRLRLNYIGSLDLELADLSKYNLLNAQEKLEYERLAGLYTSASSSVMQQQNYEQEYNEKLKIVQRGYDTDWLVQPLHSVGISSKHTIMLEGGNDSFRYGVNLASNNVAGIMKGSSRNRLGIGVKLQYNYRNLRFQNEITYDNVVSENSPYGDYSTYTNLNPYYYPYDESGKLKKILYSYGNPSLGYTSVVNPMYNIQLRTIDKTAYDDFINNFSIEWNILKELKMKARFSIEKVNRHNDVFKPADHTDFYQQESNKGSYKKGETQNLSYDGNVVVSYFKTLNDMHALSLNGGWNIQQAQTDYSSYTVYGFPNQMLDHPALGAGFLEGSSVSGDASMTRLMGFFMNVNYSYDNRYFVDSSLRIDGSSLFGSNERWGAFWSGGVGRNIHNEKIFKDSSVLNQLRLRYSMGYTGGQSFYPYQAMMMYQYNSKLTYQDYVGTTIKAFGNKNLKWQKTRKDNLGVDFGFLKNRIAGYFNYFVENSQDLLVDITMASYLGFDSYKENLGETVNKGFDFNLKAGIVNYRDFHLNLFCNGQHYVNKLQRISSGLRSFNSKADSQVSSAPYVRYIEGESVNSIWVVPSLGIDPATGKEIFIDHNGNYTNTWSEDDYVAYGSTDPKLSGSFGTNIYYKGFELNLNLYYKFGGYAYNQTLVNKVENVNPYQNVDKRALSDRWKTPGQPAKFKRIDDLSTTKPTSRFVEKDNLLSATSLSCAYTFDKSIARKIRAEYLKLMLCANDFMYCSSIKREMGTSYPFARHFTASVQVTF